MSVSVNGTAITTESWPSPELAAVHELLRQRAVAAGMLDAHASESNVEAAIENLLEHEVPVPVPSEAECRRYYEQHPNEFRIDESALVRHILFQITPRILVNQVRALAERTLMEVLADPRSFGEHARKLSNCPTSVFGGKLGEVRRGDAVPEFEAAIFADGSVGVLPNLVKTRYGFHVVAIDRRTMGERLHFEAVRMRIAERLTAAVQQRALAQYVTLLAGDAEIAGVDLRKASSPLVQ